MAEFGALWCGSSQTNRAHNRTAGARIKSHPCPSPSVEVGRWVPTRSCLDRDQTCRLQKPQCARHSNFFMHPPHFVLLPKDPFFSLTRPTSICAVVFGKGFTKEMTFGLFICQHCVCLFGYLMPGYSSSHGRGVHGRPGSQGEALHCAADHLPLLLLRRVLGPQGQQGAARPKDQSATVQVQLTGRAVPLLSRLACPQIINPNAPAAFTKPHLINVSPHKYKLYPCPPVGSVASFDHNINIKLVGFVEEVKLSAG